jgi:hypothetical protein
MAATLGNGDITFGDGTIQSTKTPTVVSAFTNDSSWTTSSALAGTYAAITTTAYSISGGASRPFNLYLYTVTGVLTSQINANCNCNC